MEQINYCIQCVDASTGNIGTFAYAPRGSGEPFYAISPIFPSLVEFYQWAETEGYASKQEYGYLCIMERA